MRTSERSRVIARGLLRYSDQAPKGFSAFTLRNSLRAFEKWVFCWYWEKMAKILPKKVISKQVFARCQLSNTIYLRLYAICWWFQTHINLLRSYISALILFRWVYSIFDLTSQRLLYLWLETSTIRCPKWVCVVRGWSQWWVCASCNCLWYI